MSELTRSSRLASIDVLRGIVMVLMALDHARDFFANATDTPENLDTTTPVLFATRWVTHFCAPVFVFLAGTSAYLYGRRVTKPQLSRFLFTRGLWLVFLEWTVVHATWFLNVFVNWRILQVIGAIGFSMIALSVLVFLPLRAVLGLGLAIVLGHNALDGVSYDIESPTGKTWVILHESFKAVDLSPLPVINVYYPLLAWIGVMACGYAFGRLYEMPSERRRKILFRAGLYLTLAFIILRRFNVYGDASPWERQDTTARTVISFLNCTKYPPSLLFLLMTLGPSLLALGFLEREPGRPGRILMVFGRVPLLFYLLHVLLMSLSSATIYYFEVGVFHRLADWPLPEGYGHSLGYAYLGWGSVVLVLYPVCAWYAGVKKRSRSPWLSYL